MVVLFPEFGARTRPQDLWPFLISETGLKFLICTQGEIHPGNRASPVNRAHMKRPLDSSDHNNKATCTRMSDWVYQVHEHTGHWRTVEIRIFQSFSNGSVSTPINDLPKITLRLLNSFSAIKFVRPRKSSKMGCISKISWWYILDAFLNHKLSFLFHFVQRIILSLASVLRAIQ